MWLDELADLIRTLRKRIEKHGDLLRKNESATRYALVDPVLRGLGWDVSDPDQVVAEFDLPGREKADYVLLRPSGSPAVVVEAKRLDSVLRDGLRQSAFYAMQCKAPYVTVTDGARFEVFELPEIEKPAVSFDVRDLEHETVLKMLWLWRGNFVAGEPVLPSQGPSLKPSVDLPREKAENGDKWISLAAFDPPVRTSAPSKIRFLDDAVLAVTRWRDLQVTVVTWLQETKRLGLSDCPVRSARGGDLVSTREVRSDGKRFVRPLSVGGLYVEANRSALDHTRAARRILRTRGVDPATVYVLPHSE